MASAQSNLARKLTIIHAFQQPEEIRLRVAAYCRVSSDSDDQLNSFAVQNAYYTETITKWSNSNSTKKSENHEHIPINRTIHGGT